MGMSTCTPEGICEISRMLYSPLFDISDKYRRIQLPVMLVGGRSDFLVNRKMLGMTKDLLKDVVFKVYKGAHSILYHTEKIWIDIDDFIQR
jgi:surfactin synthase thioesterase subunit